MSCITVLELSPRPCMYITWAAPRDCSGTWILATCVGCLDWFPGSWNWPRSTLIVVCILVVKKQSWKTSTFLYLSKKTKCMKLTAFPVHNQGAAWTRTGFHKESNTWKGRISPLNRCARPWKDTSKRSVTQQSIINWWNQSICVLVGAMQLFKILSKIGKCSFQIVWP